MTYGITGASGQLGRRAAERLLERVDPTEVVLLSRDPRKLADLAERGADVRAADFDEPGALATAFKGIDRLLLVSTDAVGDQRLTTQRAAIREAASVGVGHLLYTSLPRPEGNPAAVAADHAGTEQAIRESGLSFTFLRNNLYTEMQVDTAKQAAASGTLVTNLGEGGIAYVTRADCVDAAVGALLDSDGVYDITGPAAVTAADIAAVASTLRGSEVQVVQVDDAAYAAGLVEHAGLPQVFADLLASFGTAGRDGWLDDASDAVQRLAGHAPAAYADVVLAAQ